MEENMCSLELGIYSIDLKNLMQIFFIILFLEYKIIIIL